MPKPLLRVIARLAVLLCLMCVGSVAQTPKDSEQKLILDQTITGEIIVPAFHYYEIQLAKGEFIEAKAVADVMMPTLTVQDAANEILVRDQPTKLPDQSWVIYQAEKTALYKISVGPDSEHPHTNGHFELIARKISQPTNTELSYARLLLMQVKWWPLYEQGSPESLNELIQSSTESINIARKIGKRRLEAQALTWLAEAFKAKEQYDLALQYFQQALTLTREFGYPQRIAGVLTPIGQIYHAWGDYAHALQYYQEALSNVEQSGQPNIVGWNLTNIGHVYFAYGELSKAIPYYQRAYEEYGRYPGTSESEKPLGQGIALASLANVYAAFGEKQKAIDLLTEAVEHVKASKKVEYENVMRLRLGEHYTALGEYQLAGNYLEQAHQFFRASKGQYEAAILSAKGNIAKLQGDYETALTHFQSALTIRRQLKDKRGQAQTLAQIGAVQMLQNHSQNALNYFTEAQSLWQEIGDKFNEGRILTNLGQAYADLKNTEAARDYFTQALTLRHLSNDREGEANTLYQLARLDFAAAQFPTACKQIEAALAITESVRATVNNKDLRATYLATVKEYYEFYLELLMQMHRRDDAAGFATKAFKVSEMARARSLIETLSDTRRQLRQGAATELIKRESELQQQLNAKAEYQQKLLEKKARPELLRAADLEVETLAATLEQVRTNIRTNSPHYAELAQTQPITVADVQQSLLDDSTVLLSYALGKERSYVWAISKHQCNSYELSNRETIEAAARQVYGLLIAPPKSVSKTATETNAIKQALQSLSQLIIAPINEPLKQKRLLIVGDGALQYIPFAALPELIKDERGFAANNKTSQTANNNSQPLLVNHEIINLPSATLLAILRREIGGRQTAPKTIAVFADPVFTADDSRLQGKENYSPRVNSALLDQALREVGENSSHLPRLLSSRHEATAIEKFVTNNDRKTAIDFAANRAAVLSSDLRDYRILHFATHGLLNSVHPELSGLVFSLLDQNGKAQDGFLRLHEIYNLQLNTDLVVLSACQTALGKEIKGEGLISLTRGFMYAGAPRVIASLWKVSDRATAQMMSKFYEEMLGANKLSPAAALRASQLALMKQPRWSHPRFWAAFTLQGEWK